MTKKTIAQIGREMFLLGSFEDYDFETILSVLTTLDDLYHNGEEAFVSDDEYDALKLFAERLDPTHVYFTGVGSDVRGGKVKLPFEMGSLDQVQIGDIRQWIKENELDDEDIVLSDKMDGTSNLMLFNDEGNLQIAYSRGNGTEGADISRHISKIKDVPNGIPFKMNVRAEVELTETDFEFLRTKVMSRSGKPYKNARNMVAGLMNAKKNDPIVYDYLKVIVYEMVGSDLGKRDQLEALERAGFHVVEYTTAKGKDLTDEFLADYLNKRREEIDYAIDGLVLDVDDKETRLEMNPTRDTLNPAYSIKYKVADASNQAIAKVKSVTWNVSKHGYLKPQVNIEPVDLVGVTVSNATGFNAKFIYDNKVGRGAEVRITRSGDVIPFIQEVVKPAKNWHEPEQNWVWNETGVDAILTDAHTVLEVAIQQAIDFFASMEAPHLKEGNVRQMFEWNDYATSREAIVEMLNASKDHWLTVIGANGQKIYDGLRAKMSDMPLYVLAGSSPFFGRGVGKRKFKKLLTGLQVKSFGELPLLNKAQICSVEGFEDKTASKIVSGIEEFMGFIDEIQNMNLVSELPSTSGGSMSGEKVVFTGFRDKELQAQVEAEGGTMQSAVSSKTTILVAKNPNSNSGKMKKARDNGTRVMGIEEFKEMMG